MADAVLVTLHTCTISSTFWRVARGSQLSCRSNSVLISNPYCTTAKLHWKEAADKHLLVTTAGSEKEGSLQQRAPKSQQKQAVQRGRGFFRRKRLLNISSADTGIIVNILLMRRAKALPVQREKWFGETLICFYISVSSCCVWPVQVAEGIVCAITALFLFAPCCTLSLLGGLLSHDDLIAGLESGTISSLCICTTHNNVSSFQHTNDKCKYTDTWRLGEAEAFLKSVCGSRFRASVETAAEHLHAEHGTAANRAGTAANRAGEEHGGRGGLLGASLTAGTDQQTRRKS